MSAHIDRTTAVVVDGNDYPNCAEVCVSRRGDNVQLTQNDDVIIMTEAQFDLLRRALNKVTP